MSHLEDLLFEYYEWRGYIVRRNIKVGRLAHGGWAGELDLVGYHPKTGDLVHVEPSIDAWTWSHREEVFKRKFKCGRRYIFGEVFPWLDKKTSLKQIAVLVSGGRERRTIGGADILTVDQLVRRIKKEIAKQGIMAKAAIPEQYRLLRTVQLVLCGYYRSL